MKDKFLLISFTKKGCLLSVEISKFLEGEVSCFMSPDDLNALIKNYFNISKAIIFVSACGIAVRSIAPFLKSKLKDPAVIVIDETGKFVIPILSGHIGGANELSRKIAASINAHAVITTATDLNNIVSVDEWAVKNNCEIENPENIKKISSSLLNNNSVGVAVTEQLQPAPYPVTLFLRPKNLILGVGCKKNTDPEKFENAALKFLEGAGVSNLSLYAVASINLKANEKAILNFAEKYKIQFLTFSAEDLMKVQGDYFSSSERVLEVTGADNICERSAILAAKNNAVLLRSKFIIEGITFALARMNYKES